MTPKNPNRREQGTSLPEARSTPPTERTDDQRSDGREAPKAEPRWPSSPLLWLLLLALLPACVSAQKLRAAKSENLRLSRAEEFANASRRATERTNADLRAELEACQNSAAILERQRRRANSPSLLLK